MTVNKCVTSDLVLDACILYRHVVLDEADHMLERGFADQMDLILKECYSGEPQHVSDILDLWARGHAYSATAILGGDVMLCTGVCNVRTVRLWK